MSNGRDFIEIEGRNPWDRLPEETDFYFECFCVYRDMGLSRTVTNAYNKANPSRKTERVSGLWYQLHSKFQWKERAKLYDEYIDKLKQETIWEYEKRESTKLAADREEHKKEEIGLAAKSFRKANQILDMPLEWEDRVITGEGDKRKEVIKKRHIPPPLLFAAVALIQVGSKVGRQALGIREEEGAATSIEEFRELFYESQKQIQKHMPKGALPAPPANPAEKPEIDLTGGVIDPLAENASVNTAFKGDRERP